MAARLQIALSGNKPKQVVVNARSAFHGQILVAVSRESKTLNYSGNNVIESVKFNKIMLNIKLFPFAQVTTEFRLKLKLQKENN